MSAELMGRMDKSILFWRNELMEFRSEFELMIQLRKFNLGIMRVFWQVLPSRDQQLICELSIASRGGRGVGNSPEKRHLQNGLISCILNH